VIGSHVWVHVVDASVFPGRDRRAPDMRSPALVLYDRFLDEAVRVIAS